MPMITIEQALTNETAARDALDAAQRALDECADPTKITRIRDERDRAQAALRASTLAREDAERTEAARIRAAKLGRLAELRAKADRGKARAELEKAVARRVEAERELQRATGAAVELVLKHRDAHAEATALATELGVDGPALEALEFRMADALYLVKTHADADRRWVLGALAGLLGAGTPCDAGDYPVDAQIADLLAGTFAGKRHAIAEAHEARAAAYRAEGARLREELERATFAMNSGTRESKDRYAAARLNWERHIARAA